MELFDQRSVINAWGGRPLEVVVSLVRASRPSSYIEIELSHPEIVVSRV